MGVTHSRLAPPSWLRLPRRTARLRLTALYGGLFLLSGVALVAITYVLFERATEYRTPHLPKVPHASAIQNLKLPVTPANAVPQRSTHSRYPASASAGKGSAGAGTGSAGAGTGSAWAGSGHADSAGTDPASAGTGPASAGTGPASAGRRCASGGTGRVRPGRAARCRLSPAASQLGNRSSDRGRTRRPGRLARCRQDAATDPDHHPHGPTDLFHQSARASGPRRPAGRAQGTRGHPR